MKRFTISALSTAIVAAMAATSAQAESFVDDSKLNVHLRNFYKSQNYQTGTAKAEKDSGWVQAIRADFESGYFANLIGIDASAHYALKLSESRGNDKKSGTDLFDVDSKGKGNSYGKVFGAVKVNLMDQGVAKYGRMTIDTPLLNSSDSRTLPSTVEALYVDYSMEGFTAYGASASKHNTKGEASYDHYGYNNNKDPVNTLGVMYSMDGISATLAWGEQKDYATQLYAEGGYKFPIDDTMTVSVGAQYGMKTAKGKYKDDLEAGATADSKKLVDDIDWWGAKAGLDMGALDLSISYTNVAQKIKGDKAGLGTANQGWALKGQFDNSRPVTGSTGFAGYNSVQLDDFYADGEQSIMYKVAYDFAEMVHGLSASALYVDGTVKQDGKDADTSEYNFRVDYEVPALEGLTVTLRHARYEADDEGKTYDEDKKDTRVIVTYDLAVF
ncbi:OprD family porin [Sansalvadorimonas sp. 2012CJ34-2]|uniref:OprD family porin n=1 Tax=Parendozoicomonas callyspongiae TaxID=2942213 RepID=A0ABT0PG65_9GAMM|nr:OprD family outer membrane porin [Sansalvadorimonas sp. 2012CJ34-2]MCL6270226.1 OprD family porin [Sansalvadorimonas sp. 2012CJ34-2]